MKDFKILLMNLGYCTNLNGSLFQYSLKGYRYLYVSKKVQNKTLNKLNSLIKQENPDLICLIEIKQGKQILNLVNSEYPYYDINTKYSPKNFFNKFSGIKKNSNAIISKQNLKFKKHYLNNGTKKLLYEILLPTGVKLILFHFSLNKTVRQSQFREIHKMFKNDKKKIICGDFNTRQGLEELKYLKTKNSLRISHKTPTFPAINPKKIFDYFMYSKKLKVNTKILEDQISDHLPIVLNLDRKSVV